MELDNILPEDIEKRSFEIISQELGNTIINAEQEPVIKRVIHTTADFDYVKNLCFSASAVKKALEAIRDGASIITDTQMVKAGINKKALEAFNIKTYCFIADEDVGEEAKKQKTTRAKVSMDKAAKLEGRLIFAIGNAPTALIRIYELILEKKISPELIIGVPVGFVNVIQSKEYIMKCDVPYIVAKGRKGGSNVAAAIINSLLYMAG